MSGDSHTNFNAGAFTAGAVGASATIAGAMMAGWANHRAQQQNRWAGWDLQQMQAALDYTEDLLIVRTDERDAARRRIAELERAAADMAFVFKRERARALQAPR